MTKRQIVKQYSDEDRRRIIDLRFQKEACEWAARWSSDPFAYGRALKNLRKGLPIEA